MSPAARSAAATEGASPAGEAGVIAAAARPATSARRKARRNDPRRPAAPGDPAPRRTHEGDHPDQENEAEHHEGAETLGAVRARLALGGALLEVVGVAREHLDDVGGAALYAAG